AWMEVPKARWTSGRTRERPAHSRALGQTWLDRPALLSGRERFGALRESRSGSDRRDKIAGLVLDDPVNRRDIHGDVITCRWIANTQARRAPADDDGLPPFVRSSYRVDDLGLVRRAHDVARCDPIDDVA